MVLASVILRMSYYSEFQAVPPVTENTRSPSFVLVGGTVDDRLWMNVIICNAPRLYSMLLLMVNSISITPRCLALES